MREFYYYFRTIKGNHPRITVCLLVNGEEYSRGVSICSRLDNIDKSKGKGIAKGRALKAMFTKEDRLPVIREESGDTLLDCDISLTFILTKSEYMPRLTDHELRMVNNSRVKAIQEIVNTNFFEDPRNR